MIQGVTGIGRLEFGLGGKDCALELGLGGKDFLLDLMGICIGKYCLLDFMAICIGQVCGALYGYTHLDGFASVSTPKVLLDSRK